MGNHMPKTDKFFSKNYASLTLLFSIAYAIFYKRTHFVTIFGSLWCFLFAFMGAIYILLNRKISLIFFYLIKLVILFKLFT